MSMIKRMFEISFVLLVNIDTFRLSVSLICPNEVCGGKSAVFV
jgi:hypothetical protein